MQRYTIKVVFIYLFIEHSIFCQYYTIFESGFHYVTLHKMICKFHLILTLSQTSFLTNAIIELKNDTIFFLELLYSTV